MNSDTVYTTVSSSLVDPIEQPHSALGMDVEVKQDTWLEKQERWDCLLVCGCVWFVLGFFGFIFLLSPANNKKTREKMFALNNSQL